MKDNVKVVRVLVLGDGV